MNKQVIDVYNEMAMPADCARRIEGEMSRAIRQKKGETKFMKNEKNGQKQSWGFAVVLVCLVLVLSVGGVFLFLNVSEPKDAPPRRRGPSSSPSRTFRRNLLRQVQKRIPLP